MEQIIEEYGISLILIVVGSSVIGGLRLMMELL